MTPSNVHDKNLMEFGTVHSHAQGANIPKLPEILDLREYIPGITSLLDPQKDIVNDLFRNFICQKDFLQ